MVYEWSTPPIVTIWYLHDTLPIKQPKGFLIRGWHYLIASLSTTGRRNGSRIDHIDPLGGTLVAHRHFRISGPKTDALPTQSNNCSMIFGSHIAYESPSKIIAGYQYPPDCRSISLLLMVNINIQCYLIYPFICFDGHSHTNPLKMSRTHLDLLHEQTLGSAQVVDFPSARFQTI